MEQAIDPQTARCMQILAVIGDLWTLAIVMTLQPGPLRFNALHRAIPKANAVTLTNRLRRLEEAGIVGHDKETAAGKGSTYALTDFGRRLLPIVDTIREVALDLERSGDFPHRTT
ncbi:HxlR family transcriptional regulator [Actinocorallia herbida]|uniref:HxlR family transcriptional regulator n=1 Tax=Actinocorallia herbida TaxID=58109 RepID=A0A3N1CUA9_9ACTN|nr:helix-turn-helix domain-containing protein [Actinocorallia herbida]ROO84889.1 HxlR family transcriptional regulator [Actinocorallia herbida]